MDHADWQCILQRSYTAEDGTPFLLSLPVKPLATTGHLRIVTLKGPRLDDNGRARLSVDGGAVQATLAYSNFSNGQQRVRQFEVPLGSNPLAAARQRLTFTASRNVVEVPVPALLAALRALDGCTADLLAGFGIKPELVAAMAKAPEGWSLDFVALPGVTPFEFVALYWVGIDGRAEDCRLLKPSGDARFDTRFCSDLVAEARFKPALDREGRPMRAPQFEDVVIRRQVFAAPGIP